VIERLEPFVGTWRVEASLGGADAVATFEWTLGGAFLLQRQKIDMPEAPDALCVIAPAGEHFTQHYFDTRGVVRIYAMTFDGTTWTLTREQADFAPLDFSQRYVGQFKGGDRIDGRWEIKEAGESEYRLDFELSYVRT
jgi:hypothetical protein